MNSQLDPQNQMFTYHEVRVQEVMEDSSSEVKKRYTISIWQFGGICTPNADSAPVRVEFSDSPPHEGRGDFSAFLEPS